MESISFKEIMKMFPDEWVLLGNPIMDESKVSILSGIPVFHSKDKKEVCYLGRDLTNDYKTVTIVFAGDFKKIRRNGILRRL